MTADQCQEDIRHGLPPLPGGGKSIGDGVQETDNGGGAHLQGATEGTGSVQGVRGGDVGGICGGSQYDSALASGRGAMELEKFVHRGRAADLLNGILGQGTPADLPSGGMSRTSGNKDGDAGPLPITVFPGHRGNSIRGKPPPPIVYPMQHVGLPVGTEQQAPCHSSVHQGRRTKEVEAIRGGSREKAPRTGSD